METAITETPTGAIDVPALGDETLVRLADQAEKRVDAINKIKRAALKSTNAHDWVDQGGRPFLQSSGSEKIARIFGVSWKIEEPKFEQDERGHFSYTVKGNFTVAGATIDAIGTRSSKDGFFKKYTGKGDDRHELPPSEIDKGDVKKAAYTNLLGNGITRLLGIRNLTWEDLRESAGITQEQVARVDFKKAGRHDHGIQSEGGQTIVSGISDVRQRKGTGKNGKPYVKYGIRAANADFMTFSESFATIAKEAMQAGLECTINYRITDFGNEVESISTVEPPPRTSREPGEEG